MTHLLHHLHLDPVHKLGDLAYKPKPFSVKYKTLPRPKLTRNRKREYHHTQSDKRTPSEKLVQERNTSNDLKRRNEECKKDITS